MPALMPIVKARAKVTTMGSGWYPPDHPKHVPGLAFNGHAERALAGVKQHGSGREWFAGEGKISRVSGSRSPARKAASAQIAKIPLVLASWIGKAWYPVDSARREA